MQPMQRRGFHRMAAATVAGAWRAQVWSYRNARAFGQSLARIIGIPADAAQLQFERRTTRWQPVNEAVLAE